MGLLYAAAGIIIIIIAQGKFSRPVKYFCKWFSSSYEAQ